MASSACVASPVGSRAAILPDAMLLPHQMTPHPAPASGSPKAIVPRRKRVEELESAYRAPVVIDHTSEDILMRVLQDENAIPLPAPFGKTITNLSLRLNLKKNWYSSRDCLVYGGRQMLEDEKVREVVNLTSSSSESQYLHVFVKAEDVRSVNVTSRHRPSSALTRSLSRRSLQSSTDDLTDSPMQSQELLPIKEPVDLDAQAKSGLMLDKDDVIHLIIKKSAYVAWQHVGTGQFELFVSVSNTADMVKQRLGLHVDKHALLYNGFQLDSNKPLSEYPLPDGAVLELVPLEPTTYTPERTRSYPDGSPMLSSPEHSLFMQWQRANSGLRAGKVPSLAASGSGGSYLMHDAQGQVVAVFKPVDEEPNTTNNPRGYKDTASDHGMRMGILPGQGAFREVAAYVLDHGHRAGVPATAMVYAEMPDGVRKYGSLQAFVQADLDCEEMGPSAFPVEEVHKIAILDCRLANTDRNASNILAKRVDGVWRLFPIDHGYCLPATMEDITFEWSFWPQAKEPFSAEAREYIANLDADYDLSLLRERHIPLHAACVRIFKAVTLVLKKAAERGLTPYHVANILQRHGDNDSPLEELHRKACEAALADRNPGSEVLRCTAIVPYSMAPAQPASDSCYIAHLSNMLDTYLEDSLLDDC